MVMWVIPTPSFFPTRQSHTLPVSDSYSVGEGLDFGGLTEYNNVIFEVFNWGQCIIINE